jgi:DNA-binding NtrC family response regulator
LNLLVVDDDLDLPDILAEILASLGHRVRIARDGREGLKMLHEQLPDVVILGVEMPYLNGPEMVYRMIIEDAGMQRVPVVLVSGIVGLTQVAGRVGTPYFMGKPFDLDKLLGMLQRAGEEKRPPVPAWRA